MARVLFPHQQDALEWAKPRRRMMLAMEMRLGKTAVAIRWAELSGDEKALVIAPLTVLQSWARELSLEGSKGYLVVGSAVLAQNLPGGWYLTNYERFRARYEEYHAHRWAVIVADESTRLRNPTAQTTRSFLDLVRKRQPDARVALLSGRPAPEGPLDWGCQMLALTERWMGQSTYWGWRQRWFYQAAYEWIPRKGTISAISDNLQTYAFFLTRKQVGIGSPKVYEQRFFEPTREQRSLMTQVRKRFSIMTGSEEVETKWIVAQMSWLARLAGGFHPINLTSVSRSKTVEIVKLLSEELRDEAVVIWFRFNKELEAVRGALLAAKIPNYYIVGSTDVEQRVREVREWWDIRGTRALLVQIKCAKFGIDLSQADTAIYYSTGYELEDRLQSEDRIVHPMKKTPLLYVDLITEESLDEHVAELLLEKDLSGRIWAMKLWRKLRQKYGANPPQSP